MTIAEVGRLYDLTPDTLRYYERIGLIPSVERKSGIRNYTEDACNWVEFVKCMRGVGMSIDALVEYVSLVLQGESTIERRKALLTMQRDSLQAKMLDMKKTIERLDTKIVNYELILIKKEETLKLK